MRAPVTAADESADLPVGVRLLSALADVWGIVGAAEEAGEHPHALFHVRKAVTHLEHAHRQLVDPAGTAVVLEGEPEPVS